MPEPGGRLRKVVPRLVVLAAVIALLTTFYVSGGSRWLNLHYLLSQRDALYLYVHQHYLLALFLAGAVYTLMTALSIPGDAVLSLFLGFLFGRWVGSAVIVIAATVGATIVFLIARYLIGSWVRQRLEHHPRAARLLQAFERNVFNYLVFVRLIPLFPFWLINLAAAFTGIRLRQFIVGTLIGIIPGSFIYANLGQQLGSLRSLHGLLSPGLIGALVLPGLLALLPVAVRHWRVARHREV